MKNASTVRSKSYEKACWSVPHIQDSFLSRLPPDFEFVAYPRHLADSSIAPGMAVGIRL